MFSVALKFSFLENEFVMLDRHPCDRIRISHSSALLWKSLYKL
jgi:hypothetical protein